MLVSQPAWAGWVELKRTPRGEDIYYLDPTTLRKTADGRRIWRSSTHDLPQTHKGRTYRSVRELTEFDCAGDRARMLQLDMFSRPMTEGSLAYRSPFSMPWEFFAPDTGFEDLLKVVCKMRLK
jgi:hypothetical protein